MKYFYRKILLSFIRRSWSSIFFIVIVALLIARFQTELWPGGSGIQSSQSITTSTEKDSQNRVTKIITNTKAESGKTLWDWMSLLGVPLTLAILGFWLQRIQQERTITENKEEALQVYIDRLSALLVDKKLLMLARNIAKANKRDFLNAKASEQKSLNPEISERELLNSATDIIKARTLSILRRFDNDAERKTSVIRFLSESDIISKLQLDLSRVNLAGVNLAGAMLANVNLLYVNLIDADLSFANLTRANLLNADLGSVNFHGAILVETNFFDANLCKADLFNADCRLADFSGATLDAADLRKAKLIKAQFTSAKLNRARLDSANLNGADLEDAELGKAMLRSATICGANLKKADLSGANLRDTSLKGADLRQAILERANLENADLKGILWDSKTLWPDKKAFASVKNIPEKLVEQLGLATKMDIVDSGYNLYLLAIAKLLNSKYSRLLSFYFHALIQ
jgi:uncharacterized protein YjbI with pentapeptide repeats